MGVVVLPSRVTGFAAMSIKDEVMFIPFFQGSSNSSQNGLALGSFCRLILRTTVLLFAIPNRLQVLVFNHQSSESIITSQRRSAVASAESARCPPVRIRNAA